MSDFKNTLNNVRVLIKKPTLTDIEQELLADSLDYLLAMGPEPKLCTHSHRNGFPCRQPATISFKRKGGISRNVCEGCFRLIAINAKEKIVSRSINGN